MKLRISTALGVLAILLATTVLPAFAKPTSRFRGTFTADAPINGRVAKGKAAWRIDDKGRSRFKLRLQKVTDTTVDINACGVDLGTVAVNGKSVRIKLRSKKGDTVPDCEMTPLVTVMNLTSGLNMVGTLTEK